MLTPHPATRIVRSRFPAVSIFAANRGDGPVGRIEAGPEDALVTRPGLEVLVRRLPPGGAAFLARLAAGEPLGAAAAAALADEPGLRSRRQHRRAARGRRLHRRRRRTMPMASADRARGRRWQGIGLVARASAVARAIAQPSLTQLALRLALRCPFWRSGVNKWDGFLQLNDVAVLLFSSEFKLHLPGGPYPFPAPGLVAFASACAEIVLPVLLVLGLGTRLAALGLLAMTAVIQLTRAGGLAGAPDLGGDGARRSWPGVPGGCSLDHWLLPG